MTRGALQRAITAGLAALLVAACSAQGPDVSLDQAIDDAVADGESGLTLADFGEYLDDARSVPLPASDAAPPAVFPDAPGGASGYSRYVFRPFEDRVLLSLVEGPLGRQTRCQELDLPCSHDDLVALAASGKPIPRELGLTRSELEQLVDELNATRSAVARYADVEQACADGFFSDRTQTPNMGSHFTNMDNLLDGRFDPANPEILLYAAADGAEPSREVLGQCGAQGWTGGDVELVATAFILLTGHVGDDHPEGFTGDLDNWHIHYNLCRGSGTDSIVDREACERRGGEYYDSLGWMMHAWVAPEYDNQLGVFSMWNPAVWPVTDPAELHRRSQPEIEGAVLQPIENFSFGTVTARVGEPVVWSNTDSVAHTVTAGTPDAPRRAFDSGVFAPGESFTNAFAEPGEYPYFCTLHPDMAGSVIVEE